MGVTCAAALTAILLGYVFWPQGRLFRQRTKTRFDYLEERKAAVYDNLRDLRFEFQAGKYPEEDYAVQREALEREASTILEEMDLIETARR